MPVGWRLESSESQAWGTSPQTPKSPLNMAYSEIQHATSQYTHPPATPPTGPSDIAYNSSTGTMFAQRVGSYGHPVLSASCGVPSARSDFPRGSYNFPTNTSNLHYEQLDSSKACHDTHENGWLIQSKVTIAVIASSSMKAEYDL